MDLELEQTFPASDALQITRDRPPVPTSAPAGSDETQKAARWSGMIFARITSSLRGAIATKQSTLPRARERATESWIASCHRAGHFGPDPFARNDEGDPA
jgi:hypothetical protein